MAKKSYWETGYYPQPTEAQLKRNAAQTAKKAADKGKQLCPVVITGRAIAKSWWGKAWCANLERYADVESRLPRGAHYVRCGAVMCKHVAAALYGVAARLDEDPHAVFLPAGD